MRLGHCICDPRRPCPCDVFREQGICPCAGERPEPKALSQIKLTALARNPGCASKIAPADLEEMLRRLPPVTDPAVISGLAAADDAAIYRVAGGLCLVQTVDVFTPCVDDPRLFGRICAANCLSDVYAMGGAPRTALSILAFPSETLAGEIMYQMLAGAMETMAEAGVALIGGHSIKDEEIKLGFAITGVIDPKTAAALETPRAGDTLVLTKPLGVGVLSFAQQMGRAPEAGLAAAARSMAALNRAAAEAMRESGASACTDITGFGLFGHLARMLRPHGLSARIQAGALPAFEGVLELLRAEVISGAIERNREYVGGDLEIEPGVDAAVINLGLDAQTSGGLLIAVPPERLEVLRQNLKKRGVTGFVIGSVVESASTRIILSGSSRETRQDGLNAGVGTIIQTANAARDPSMQIEGDQEEGAQLSNDRSQEEEPSSPRPSPPKMGGEGEAYIPIQSEEAAHGSGCCAEVFGQEPMNSSAAEALRAFGALLRSVQAGGALDERTKELILFSLLVQSRCQPCFKAHYEKARALGITQAELDEAAWCAVAMGGAPVRMFYQEAMRAASSH